MPSVVGAENGKVVQCWRSVVVFLVYTHHHPKICTNFAPSLKTLPFAFRSANFRIQDLRKRKRERVVFIVAAVGFQLASSLSGQSKDVEIIIE
jgi:hypothetical protein